MGILAAWPGAIHLGNGKFQTIIDQRANPRQRDAIEAAFASALDQCVERGEAVVRIARMEMQVDPHANESKRPGPPR